MVHVFLMDKKKLQFTLKGHISTLFVLQVKKEIKQSRIKVTSKVTILDNHIFSFLPESLLIILNTGSVLSTVFSSTL